jgi:GH15 family glucan-1,4-alpha-glucosidase
MKTFYKWMSRQKLRLLQHESGLFVASNKSDNGYNHAAWIRDNVYEALGLEQVKDYKAVLRAYHALLDLLLKHESKIDCAIKNKPTEKYQYIHARYNPETFEEFWDEWGNKQNDAIGAFLFKIADLMDKGLNVIRNENDLHIIQKLVNYLASIEYWHDSDNGMWENEEMIHASSIGACLAGLKRISNYVEVPHYLIENGQKALDELLPRESHSREVDLALLSLIYPYNIVSTKQRDSILKNVEEKLVRKHGIIRYFGDWYFNNGSEAEWCFGFPWLAKIYKEMGNTERCKYFIKKTHSVMDWKGNIPELYFDGKPNNNTPLGWAHAIYLCAIC